MSFNKTPSSKQRHSGKYRYEFSTIDHTPNNKSLRESRMSHSKTRAIEMNKTMNNIFKKRARDILDRT